MLGAPSLRRAPERVETPRLVIQRPRTIDVPSIFRRYAGDLEATRYLSWPVHASEAQTRGFLAYSDDEWRRWPAGPYLVFSRDGDLLGGTGLSFEAHDCAQTGYVLARDAWGRGYATESLQAMVDLGRTVGVRVLYALCHAEHRPSAHVLEKCDFTRASFLPQFAEFPDLAAGTLCAVLKYSRSL